jgi:hypothetical protein
MQDAVAQPIVAEVVTTDISLRSDVVGKPPRKPFPLACPEPCVSTCALVAKGDGVTTRARATCRVCGLGPTIDAHLFPRALGHDVRGNEKHLFVGGADAPGRRIVQAGLFDPTILCADHDGRLGAYDDYGIAFCRDFAARCSHPAPDIWRVRDVDADRLVRFWVAILWRFSLSCLVEAAKIKLGPYEDRLRDILFAGADCSVEPAIIMLRYRSAAIPPENICFTPYASAFSRAARSDPRVRNCSRRFSRIRKARQSEPDARSASNFDQWKDGNHRRLPAARGHSSVPPDVADRSQYGTKARPAVTHLNLPRVMAAAPRTRRLCPDTHIR